MIFSSTYRKVFPNKHLIFCLHQHTASLTFRKFFTNIRFFVINFHQHHYSRTSFEISVTWVFWNSSCWLASGGTTNVKTIESLLSIRNDIVTVRGQESGWFGVFDIFESMIYSICIIIRIRFIIYCIIYCIFITVPHYISCLRSKP